MEVQKSLMRTWILFRSSRTMCQSESASEHDRGWWWPFTSSLTINPEHISLSSLPRIKHVIQADLFVDLTLFFPCVHKNVNNPLSLQHFFEDCWFQVQLPPTTNFLIFIFPPIWLSGFNILFVLLFPKIQASSSFSLRKIYLNYVIRPSWSQKFHLMQNFPLIGWYYKQSSREVISIVFIKITYALMMKLYHYRSAFSHALFISLQRPTRRLHRGYLGPKAITSRDAQPEGVAWDPLGHIKHCARKQKDLPLRTCL